MANSGSSGGASGGGAIRAGRAFVELFAKDVGLKAGLDRAKSLVLGIGSALKTASIVGLGATTAIGAGLAALGKSAGDRATEFQRLSDRIGVPVDQLSAFAYAAEQTGQTVQDLEGHFENFAERVFQASQGTGEAAETFKKLGIDAREFIKLNPVDQLNQLADAMNGITNDTQRRGLLSALGSDQFQGLNELFKKGSAGIRELMAAAREDGGVLDPEQTREASKAMLELNRAWTVGKNAALSLGMAILPSAENARRFTGFLREAITQVKEWTSRQWEAVKAVISLGDSAGGILGRFQELSQGIANSLDKGDAKGAVDIFTGEIELKFAQFVNGLSKLWSGFAGRFAETFVIAVAAVKSALIDAQYEAEQFLTGSKVGKTLLRISGLAAIKAGFEEEGRAAINAASDKQDFGLSGFITAEEKRDILEYSKAKKQKEIIDELANTLKTIQESREDFAKAAGERLVAAQEAQAARLKKANQAIEIAPAPRVKETLAEIARQQNQVSAVRGQFGGRDARGFFGGANNIPEKQLAVAEQQKKEAEKANELLGGIQAKLLGFRVT